MELKHYAWIFEAAATHYAKQVEEMEQEIIRHTHFINEPISVPHRAHNGDRRKEIARLTDSLKTYREIVDFCRNMRENFYNACTEEAVKGFQEMIRKTKQ